MTDLKDFASEDAFNLHVSFHLVGDSTYKRQKTRLEQILEELFPNSYELELEDPDGQHDREVIFRIARPVITEDDEKLRDYFNNLKELFDATQRHLPSFTQGVEAS